MSVPSVAGASPFESVSATLVSAVREIEPKLRAFSEREVSSPPASGKWSPKQTLGHLIDSASNNHQRFLRAQLQGDGAHPGYDGEAWVRVADPQSVPWPLLIDLWTSYNLYLAHVLACIPVKAASIQCEIGGQPAVSLLFVAQDYVEHMRSHLREFNL